MQYSSEYRFRSQFEFLKRQFLQDGGLPFTDILSRETVEEAFDTIKFVWNERIDTPLVTLWVFLGQVLSAYHSCRNAVARLVVPAPNQQAYPQTWNQKRGAGVPLARVGAVLSLACGAILDLRVAKCAGKGQGEVTLLHEMSQLFSTGDVLLADALMCNWKVLYSFTQRGVDVVTRINKAHRKADFRRGKRLGKDDHLVEWKKPFIRGAGRAAQLAMPPYITVREARVRITQQGFRTRTTVIVTTLLDPSEYSKDDLADLYRARWNNELDLRSIKSVMPMECLRCKTPELVRKEIWTHALAYNLIRAIMAQAASSHALQPRSISFKGARQTLEAFQSMIAMRGQHDSTTRRMFYEQLLTAVAAHRVADRPDRIEPRQITRRHKHYVPLSVPRAEAKLLILKGLSKN